MTKKNSYAIIAILLVLGVYGYEFLLDEQENAAQIAEGGRVKPETFVALLPTSTTGQIIHHHGYSLSYSEPHEQAEWVAYQLKTSHLSSANFQRPYFEVDQAVKTGAASWKNYKNSGYDKGHLCPAGDKNYSREAHDETFLTSNISPQNHDFNAGIWNSLEQKVRYWTRKHGDLYIVTGGVLKDDLPAIGSEKVAVPKHFYKIIYDSDHEKMIAFLIPNKASRQPLSHFVVPVDSVEKVTRIDFFAELEDELESSLEAVSSYEAW